MKDRRIGGRAWGARAAQYGCRGVDGQLSESMIGLGWVMFKQRGRLLFVNKKQQKNFFPLRRAGFVATGPSEQKFFAPLFSKKAASLLFQAEPIRF
jgi:hypothetical protein